MHEAILGERMKPMRDFLMKHKKFLNPDELYFSILNYNSHLQIPGSCKVAPAPKEENGVGFLAKFVIWNGYNIPCHTKYVRNVCILGTPHVKVLKKVPHLFANKFHTDYHPEAYDHMEDWYFEKFDKESIAGTYDKMQFDPSVYANRTCSQMHI